MSDNDLALLLFRPGAGRFPVRNYLDWLVPA